MVRLCCQETKKTKKNKGENKQKKKKKKKREKTKTESKQRKQKKNTWKNKGKIEKKEERRELILKVADSARYKRAKKLQMDHGTSFTRSLIHSFTHSTHTLHSHTPLTHSTHTLHSHTHTLTHTLTHSCLDDNGACPTNNKTVTQQERLPRASHRDLTSDAREVARREADGDGERLANNVHRGALGHAADKVGQTGQGQATKRGPRRAPEARSGTSQYGPTSTWPTRAVAGLWALFRQSLPCQPWVQTSTRPDAFACEGLNTQGKAMRAAASCCMWASAAADQHNRS